MELEVKVYTKEEIDRDADELGRAITARVSELLASSDVQTLAQLIAHRLGVATLNHNHWSKDCDTDSWKAVVADNDASVSYVRELHRIVSDEATSKLSDGKQKALAEAAVAQKTEELGNTKAAKARNEVYKNFWQEWIVYLTSVSNLVRDVVIQKSIEAKLTQTGEQ